jgi:hypothetical protein
LPKLLVNPLVRFVAVVGALGIVTVKPVNDPPVDVVTEVHQAGSPVLLSAKNIKLPSCVEVKPVKVIPVPSPVKANQ